MLHRAVSLLSHSVFAAVAVVLGLQVVATGFALSVESPQRSQFGGHAPAISLPLASTPVALDLEDGEAKAGPAGSPSRVEARSRPASDDGCTEVFTAWRADDALARAGRLSSPSTAPPLSGA